MIDEDFLKWIFLLIALMLSATKVLNMQLLDPIKTSLVLILKLLQTGWRKIQPK